MLFEIEKPRLLYFKQHFDTEDVYNSATNTITLALFLKYYIELIPWSKCYKF